MENARFSPKLIIGIGNPSNQYSKTYHNAGILFIDFIAQNNNLEFKKTSKIFETTALDKIKIAKSLTFMNESGKSVLEAVKYLSVKNSSTSSGKLKTDQIAVAHDDVDIKLGEYKISFGKSSAGHKGIESVIKHLKTQNFWRIRIGIGKETGIFRKKKLKAEKYVLNKISPADSKLLELALNKILKELE